MAHTGEEAALLRQRAAVRHHAEDVHLKAIVVMEAQRFMLDHAPVELETALLQPFSAARMTGIEDRHVVLFRHAVDRREQAREVLLRVDVLLAMCGEQDVLALCKSQPGVDVARLDLF